MSSQVQWSYFLQCSNLVLLASSIGDLSTFSFVFLVNMVFLFWQRIPSFFKSKRQYLLLEFCFMYNLFLSGFTIWRMWKGRGGETWQGAAEGVGGECMLQGIASTSFGPLLLSALLYGNTLFLAEHELMMPLLTHTLPPMLTWTFYVQGQRGTSWPDFSCSVLLPLSWWTVHALLESFFSLVLLPAPEGYSTLYKLNVEAFQALREIKGAALRFLCFRVLGFVYVASTLLFVWASLMTAREDVGGGVLGAVFIVAGWRGGEVARKREEEIRKEEMKDGKEEKEEKEEKRGNEKEVVTRT